VPWAYMNVRALAKWSGKLDNTFQTNRLTCQHACRKPSPRKTMHQISKRYTK